MPQGSRKAVGADALLDAVCRIVADGGLSGLSLRPLADALAVSVSVLTRQYGVRIDIIAAICAAACERDALFLDEWRATLEAAVPAADIASDFAPGIAAELAEAVLDDMGSRQRALSLLYLELLHACTWDPALPPVFAAWAARRTAFWNALARAGGLAQPLVECGWWAGYVVAELAYGMALGGAADYRLIRRLCLRRLFAGGSAHGEHAADARLFAVLGARVRRAQDALGARPVWSDTWLAQAARACGILLATGGSDALTHRAVAKRIGVPHTTLGYRLPTQRDLVVAGLESIAAHILAAVDAGSLDELQRRRTADDGAGLDLARASFAAAMATLRIPELLPYTASMRARRGDNLIKVFRRYLPGAHGIDPLCAQVVSMGLTGLTNLAPPGAAAEASVAAAFAAATDWLQAQAGGLHSG